MAESVQTVFERYEKKYLLSRQQRDSLLNRMEEHMVKDRYGEYTIGSIYYDTKEYSLIRASLDRPVYKEKLRLRSYLVPGDNSPVFVEIKKKYKGIVYKRRICLEKQLAVRWLSGQCRAEEVAGAEADFTDRQIAREIQWFLDSRPLRPSVYLAYDRQAWYSPQTPGLRITFDTNIRWRDQELDLSAGTEGQRLTGEDQVLMEIKIPDSMPLWLARTLSELQIYPASFSKYGRCYEACLCPKQWAEPACVRRTAEEKNSCQIRDRRTNLC